VDQKGLDLILAHVGRMAQPMEADEGAAPMHVSLLGLQAVVHASDALAHPIAQARRLQGRQSNAIFVCKSGFQNALVERDMCSP
jgi:hypothetical protein